MTVIPPIYGIIVPPIEQHDLDGPYRILAHQQLQTIERQGKLLDDQNRELNALHRIIAALVHQNPDHELVIFDSTIVEMDTEVQIRTMHDGTINAARITTSAWPAGQQDGGL